MSFDFLRNVTERVIRQWKRYELNEKFIEMARELLVAKEKNLQDQKKIAELEDENRRLKGEKERPKFEGKKKIPNRDTSDLDHDDDDQDDSPRSKKKLKVDKEVEVDVDKSILPKDARYIGSVERIVQNLKVERENTKFIFKRYYSPSENKTYIGEVEDYQGSSFGNDLRAFIDYMYFKLRVPHEKIISFLSEFEIEISAGQLSRLLTNRSTEFEDEMSGARHASVKKAKSNHLDETGHKLNNQPLYTFCFSNRYVTFLSTYEDKTKREALASLFGGNELYCFSKRAFKLLDKENDNRKFVLKCRSLIGNGVYSRKTFDELIKTYNFSPEQATKVRLYAIYGAYREGLLGPPIKHLVTDDAPNLTIWRRHQLCWVHEIRKYKLLEVFGLTTILDDVLKQLRLFYRRLRAFRKNPSVEVKILLEKEFTTICNQDTGLRSVNEQLARTLKNKKKLLYILSNPLVEIHNNLVESDIREKVIKRKISLFNRSMAGVKSWDLMLSLASTCRKNGISFFKYLVDRYNSAGSIPYLGQIILSS